MEEMDVIDRFLETFMAYIDSGFGLLAGDVAYLTTTLIVIDITLAGLFWALSQTADVIAGLLKKVLYVGFFAFILGNFSILANILFASFAELGVKAGSSTLTAGDLMRPGYIAGVGFEAAFPLLADIGDMLGPISFFHNLVPIAVMLLAWLVILIAFFVLAVQLFVTILEFKLTTLAGFILVPFALWNRTAFLAERVLGHVITSGIKLMVLAIVIGIGSTLFTSITDAFGGPGDVTLAEVMGTVLASIVFLWLGIFAPGIASGLVTGAPQLGAGSMVGATAAIGAGAVLATTGTAVAGRTALGGVSSAVKAGASLSGGARISYDLGRMASGRDGWRGAAAGMAAVAQAGSETLRRRAGQPFASVVRARRRGSETAFAATGGTMAHGAEANSTGSDRPAWARRLRTDQRVQHAGAITVHALKEGDRGMTGDNPNLKREEE
ncbi:P-type conjugative transfer protein TrbL [uncultured Hyphomonas sp.]|uniref:P-type conjugative transfer protein TrbL n=1 Tax=uncultured Hyphomonas sp. TaxID=225298 RepID=UPI0030D7F272|tara:strand:+ start:2931 stop:4247 length:1317 start_codon:yes stop_codon:yes gene_type:complete